jgi:hypothetical protein
VENTTIGGSLIIQGNSTSNIVNSTVDKCSIIHESKITFINSTIRTLIEAKEDTDVRLENTSVPQINLANQSSLYINQESRNLAINKITTSFNYQSEIRLQSTKLNLLDIFAGDQVSPNEYGPGYDPDRNISKINLILVNSQISRIRTEDDSQINITLQNSDLNEFSFKKSKNELVLITILDLGGNYSMPDPWPEVDLEIHIYHRTFVTTLVNNIPIQAFIEVIDQNGKTIKSQYTNSYGRVNLDMLVEQIMKDSFKKAGDYNLNLNYLGFAKTTTLSAGINEKLVIEWEDYNPPNINDIQSDTKYTRTKRDTRIRAEIIDTDVKVVANATIFFQYNRGSGWSPWYTKSMIEVENNIYEGEIPLQPDGTEVRYFIVANDILGNKYESEINKYTIENPEIMVIFAGVVFLCIFFILSILYFMKRRARFKKYLNKPLS